MARPVALARHASAQTSADQAPTNFTVTLTNDAVTLSWAAPAEDAASVTGYQVLRRRPDEGESAFQTLMADTMSTSTTYVDATADEEGVRYEYQVQALRGVTASAVSNPAELSLRKANPSSDTGLDSLSLGAVVLSPGFDTGTTSYTATVDNDVDEVTVTAEASSDYATVAVTPAEGDDPDTEGVEVALVEGQNVVTVTVTAEDGTTGTYTVTVTRQGS